MYEGVPHHIRPLDAPAARSARLLKDEVVSRIRPLSILAALVMIFSIDIYSGAFLIPYSPNHVLNVAFRMMLWPMITLSVLTSITRYGVADLVAPFAIFLPFVVVGLVSALISVEPITALRQLTFWLVGVLGASSAGRQLGAANLGKLLFWTCASMLLLCLVYVFAFPHLGLELDERAGGFVWRGIFTQKNGTAWFSSLACLIILCVRDVKPLWRLGGLVLTALIMYGSKSVGGSAQLVTAIGLMGIISVLRRLPIPPSLQATLIVGGCIAATVIGYVFEDQLLGLVGRDATFTGRTGIWRAYLDRAFNSWFIGAGPGSFTQRSATTIDVSMSLQSLGLIQTPHNMYIATFGEVGVVGLVAYLVPLMYFAFVQGVLNPDRIAVLVSGLAFSLLLSGFFETREVFGFGLVMLLVVALRAATGYAEGGVKLAPQQKRERLRPGSRPVSTPSGQAPSRGPLVLG